MDSTFHAHQEWERFALIELYREYSITRSARKLSMKPAVIELFDSETLWGQWDPESRTIRLARKLLKRHTWFQVIGILLHEMAHQVVDELQPPLGPKEAPHGETFKKACLRLGVPAEFSKASADLQSHSLDWREQKRDESSEKMLEKVKKLLALAESSNENESVLAMNRVRELYAKHNLEQASRTSEKDVIHIIISSGNKRIESHEQQIVAILVGHFFVQILSGSLYHVPSGERHRVLEIIGTRENAMMAEFVYHFLKQHTKHLLEEASKSALKSRGVKFNRLERKSFLMGTLRGFANKLEASETVGRKSAKAEAAVTLETVADIPAEEVVGKAVAIFENDSALEDYISQVYPRLRRGGRTTQSIDPKAYSAGQDAGKKISLHRPITSASSVVGKLLGFRS